MTVGINYGIYLIPECTYKIIKMFVCVCSKLIQSPCVFLLCFTYTCHIAALIRHTVLLEKKLRSFDLHSPLFTYLSLLTEYEQVGVKCEEVINNNS